jgi:hypothetical protein
MVSLHPHIRVWRDPVSGKFGDKKKKASRILGLRKMEKTLLHTAAHIPASYVAKTHPVGRIAKKVRKIHKAKHTRKVHALSKAAFLARMAAGRRKAALKRGGKKALVKMAKRVVSHRRKAVKHAVKKLVVKSHRRIGAKIMAKRRKSRKISHKNPFKGILGKAKGFVSTDLLIDGALVAVGMTVSKFGLDFAAAKVPFLATPYAKLGTRLAGGFGVLYAGKWIGKRYAEPIALGFIAPAVLDVVEMVLPNLLPAGGVKMLASGYMPDVQAQVSLEQGYMPDVQSGVGDYMPDIPAEMQ